MRLIAVLVAASIAMNACATDSSSIADTTASTSVTISEEPPSDAELTSEEPESSQQDIDDVVIAESSETETGCSAPALTAHFVDVELDDEDGGLNVREAAGVSASIIATIERGQELIPTGECQRVGDTDWWQVTNTDGSLIGWASSRFLSDTVILSPGLGAPIADTDNIGLTAETLDGLAAQLAISYGLEVDALVIPVGQVEGTDATSGTATYDLRGLQDDASDGYRIEFQFLINRDESVDPVTTTFSTTAIERRPLCSRGVSDDGLCV